MISRSIEPSHELAQALDRFVNVLGHWIKECVAKYADISPTDGHDQGTFTTGWEPYIMHTRNEQATSFTKRLRDKIKKHFTGKGLWRHGYWTMGEAHHGTEHFELFLGSLLRMDPQDTVTTEHLLDAAEHLGNWVEEVPPWFDWDRLLFRSFYFGTDGIRSEPGMRLNIPDHMRCVNIALLAFEATGANRYIKLASSYALKWAQAVLQEETLPIALDADGPVYQFSETRDKHYRSFVGQIAPGLVSSVDRAENLLASGAIEAFLKLQRCTGNENFRLAAEKLLDVLVSQLADADAGAVSACLMHYRESIASDRYDKIVLDAFSKLDPFGIREIQLALDPHLLRKPSGIGKRTDMLRWLENGRPRRHSPALLALAAVITSNEALAARALDIGRTYLELAREILPDGMQHGCSARSVSAVARGHGRENHTGVTTAVLKPILEKFFTQVD